MRACPEKDTWVSLLDRELKESEAEALRSHAVHCSKCAEALSSTRALVARLASPVPGLPSPGAAGTVMQRVRARTAAPQDAPSLRPRVFLPRRVALGGAAAVALAATLVLVTSPPERLTEGTGGMGSFAARGGPAPERNATARVGVGLLQVRPALRRLQGGERLDRQAVFTVAHRHLEPGDEVYLLVFGVDVEGEVHWLFPAHLSADSDEPSVRLSVGRGGAGEERVLEESVVLEDPPKGTFRFVTVLSPKPLKVSDVERLSPAERVLDALRRRWPSASVQELTVTLE